MDDWDKMMKGREEELEITPALKVALDLSGIFSGIKQAFMAEGLDEERSIDLAYRSLVGIVSKSGDADED